MDNESIIYDDGTHKCIMFSFDDESHEDSFLSVNQFLIIQNENAILIDPGSTSIVYEMQEAVSRHIELEKLKYIFFSHQDPDVAGSIAEWGIVTSAKFILSALWVRFMSHYGLMDMDRIIGLEDKGTKIDFGDDVIQFIPAHFLHSPGNFTVYDNRSKTLFSGDIGAAIVPSIDGKKEAGNFDEHLEYMAGFHKRYMAGNIFCKQWVKSVSKFEIDTITPQHGLILKGENATKFLAWFQDLKCGGDYIEQLY